MSLGTDQHNQYASNAYQGESSDQKSNIPTEKYQAPPGPPPPNYGSSHQQYAPPSGPPPQHDTKASSTFPQQPPPSWDPPPYHDWTVIPDTALLPPPPSLGYDTSPTANASGDAGDRGLAWTKANPLWPSYQLQPSTLTAISNAQLALLKPPTYVGDVLPQPHAGHWKCYTYANCQDACLLTNLPIYSATHHSPLVTEQPKTVYFEIKVTSLGRGESHASEEADAGIAIGFAAPPYPTFRLPGWERASLGVHGDDGRRYVNDPWGGIDFTTAFAVGDTLGIGMTFSVPKDPPNYEAGQQGKVLDIEVFFTRNGKKVGHWDGNEELDMERSEGGNTGLRGEKDLFPAIGVFGGIDFEVMFHEAMWEYNPSSW